MFSAIFIIIFVAGCATGLNSIQQQEYLAMQERGVLVKEKDPQIGVALGFLPGCGSFYAGEIGFGIVNLLLWPSSILWDPISGYQGAKAVNYHLTKMKLKKQQQKELLGLEYKLQSGAIDNKKYVLQKRNIENKYEF